MRINPTTITVSDHHLVEAINALHARLARLTPRSPAYERIENALLAIQDARDIDILQRASARVAETANAAFHAINKMTPDEIKNSNTLEAQLAARRLMTPDKEDT